MVQEFSIVSDPIMLHIWSCLHNYAYEDAIFTAERLYAETKSSESLYLLATTLYRFGRPKQVSRLLTSVGSLDAKSRYLLSKCYFDFGLLNEAEEALIGHTLAAKAIEEVEDLYKEQTAYALLLLGDINRRQGRFSDASNCYRKCLEFNPLLWTAFKHLCDIGECPDSSNIFRLNDNFTLPTLTYQVVHSAARSVHMDDSFHTPSVVNVKENSVELISFDGTLNHTSLSYLAAPNDTKTIPHNSIYDSKVEPNSQRAYVTFCAQKDDSIRLGSFLKKPQDISLINVAPKAPKPDHTMRSTIHPSLPYRTSNIISGSPMFGELSLLSQSPLFACIPAFCKVHSIAGESHPVSSNRSVVYTRQTDLNTSSNSKLSPHNNPNPSTITRKKSKQKDAVSTPRVSIIPPPSLSATGYSRVPTEQTTTSTPATSSAFLRRLIYPTSPNSSAIGAQSAVNAASPTGVNSTNQPEPPILRSSSQRTTPTTGVASLPSSTPSSPTRDANSAHKTLPTQSSRRLDKTSSLDEDSSVIGPRTRSQVASASRSSVSNRHPTRTSSTKTGLKRTDGKIITSPAAVKAVTDRTDMVPNVPPESSKPCTHILESGTAANEFATVDIPVSDTNDPRTESLRRYINLLHQLGKAYQLLVKHDWRAATRLLSKLPYSHLATGRVLSWAAQAYMDNADYAKAQKLFSEARRLESWQLVGMDLYSTVLWQRQADHELSLLAHDLLELDRTAPQPWCAAGNFFSVQSEHETAVRFFQRAIQVCPSNAYAFTLLGHEQSNLEEFDKALIAFRHALRLDPWHYNAMFGISNVYYKQEKFELSESHLTRAVNLFPHSHLLLTNLAVLRGRLGHLDDGPESALALISEACRIQPNDAFSRYHKSSILFHLGQYSEVLAELKKLLTLTPREAMVYLMIGHTYKKLNNTPLAMIHYSWAMGLDPKGANTHLRDIMTNPPVATRSLSRRSGETLGVENNASTGGVGRPTRRSRLLHVADRILYDDALTGSETTIDPGLSETDARNPDDDSVGGIFNSSHYMSSASSRNRGNRVISDVSLLLNMDESDEDGDGRFETMDLGNDNEEGDTNA